VADRTESGAIVGRRAELRALGRLVTAVAAGRGGVGWVQGEPGIGASTVLDAVLDRAAELGCAVRRGAASGLLQPFPLRLLADCLGISGQPAGPQPAGPAARDIAGLLRGGLTGAGLTGADAIDPVLAAGERMLELVSRWCARGPVVLAVEDLQWADEPSLLFWSRLARATGQLPFLLLGAARPHQQVRLDQLREQVAAQGGVLLDLGPMDPDSVADLAGRISGAQPGARLRLALQRAGGNPRYVTELVNALARDGLLAVTGDGAELRADAPASPVSLHVTISGRLGFVPAATRKTLRMAAVLGTETTRWPTQRASMSIACCSSALNCRPGWASIAAPRMRRDRLPIMPPVRWCSGPGRPGCLAGCPRGGRHGQERTASTKLPDLRVCDPLSTSAPPGTWAPQRGIRHTNNEIGIVP